MMLSVLSYSSSLARQNVIHKTQASVDTSVTAARPGHQKAYYYFVPYSTQYQISKERVLMKIQQKLIEESKFEVRANATSPAHRASA